jgi:hypothetical protein
MCCESRWAKGIQNKRKPDLTSPAILQAEPELSVESLDYLTI